MERAFPQPRDEAVVSKANRGANLSSCPRSAVSEVRNLFLRAVGRKTRRAQETVYSFRLFRAGFEPFRGRTTSMRCGVTPRAANDLTRAGRFPPPPEKIGALTGRICPQCVY